MPHSRWCPTEKENNKTLFFNKLHGITDNAEKEQSKLFFL
jgi:hypothetical protein